MDSPRKPTLDALMSVRFFAAMHVVCHHYLLMIPAWRAAAPEWMKRLVGTASTEVTLFFILSGFVLAYNYLSEDGSLQVGKREFWVARIARVYPIYVFGLIVYAPIAFTRYLSGTGDPIIDAGPGTTLLVSGILTLFTVQTFVVVFQVWNPPCWSVSDEAFFYVAFPWIAPRIARLKTARMLQVMTALWICSLALPIYYLVAILGHSSKQAADLWDVGLGCQPPLRIVPFIVGIGAAVCFLRSRKDRRLFHPLLLNITMLAILLACAIAPHTAFRLMENALTPLLAIVVYLLAVGQGAVAKLLTYPALVRLGEATYAMYILHNPLWNYIARLPNIYSFVFHHHFPKGLARPGTSTEWNYDINGWTFCVYVVILVCLGLLTHRYIEQPMRAWVRGRFAQTDRRGAAATMAATAAAAGGVRTLT